MSNIYGKPTILIQVPNQRLFTKGAAARYLGIDEKTLRKISDLGALPSVAHGHGRAYKLDDLDRYINELPPWMGK